MKRYKLLKEYPNSPKLGTILKLTSTGRTYTEEEPYTTYYLKSLIENSPEYWQEIIEKEYEILSFIENQSGCIFHKNKIVPDRYDLSGNGFLYGEQALNCAAYSIYTIKRLSDGELFTIGDKYINQFGNTSTLKQFRIAVDQIDLISSCETTTWIKDATKAKQKLFTTEDGVDIFERDIFFYITDTYQILSFVADKHERISSSRLDFSTKEAAEDYILYNKPCLSFNDVINYLTESGYKLPGYNAPRVTKTLMQNTALKEIVKKKIYGN